MPVQSERVKRAETLAERSESVSTASGALFDAVYDNKPSSVSDEHAKKQAAHETGQDTNKCKSRRQLMAPYDIPKHVGCRAIRTVVSLSMLCAGVHRSIPISQLQSTVDNL